MILGFCEWFELGFGVCRFYRRWGRKCIFLLLLIFLILLFPEWLFGFLLLYLLLRYLLSKHRKWVYLLVIDRYFWLFGQTLKMSAFLVRIILIIHVGVLAFFNFVIWCLFLDLCRRCFRLLKFILFRDSWLFLNTWF